MWEVLCSSCSICCKGWYYVSQKFKVLYIQCNSYTDNIWYWTRIMKDAQTFYHTNVVSAHRGRWCIALGIDQSSNEIIHIPDECNRKFTGLGGWTPNKTVDARGKKVCGQCLTLRCDFPCIVVYLFRLKHFKQIFETNEIHKYIQWNSALRPPFLAHETVNVHKRQD